MTSAGQQLISLAAIIGPVLVPDAPERERLGYRLKGGLGDGDADHAGDPALAAGTGQAACPRLA